MIHLQKRCNTSLYFHKWQNIGTLAFIWVSNSNLLCLVCNGLHCMRNKQLQEIHCIAWFHFNFLIMSNIISKTSRETSKIQIILDSDSLTCCQKGGKVLFYMCNFVGVFFFFGVQPPLTIYHYHPNSKKQCSKINRDVHNHYFSKDKHEVIAWTRQNGFLRVTVESVK